MTNENTKPARRCGGFSKCQRPCVVCKNTVHHFDETLIMTAEEAIAAYEDAETTCRIFDDDTINYFKYLDGKDYPASFTGTPPPHPPLLTKIREALRLLKVGLDVLQLAEAKLHR